MRSSCGIRFHSVTGLSADIKFKINQSEEIALNASPVIACPPPAIVERVDAPGFLTGYRIVMKNGAFIDLVGGGLTAS
jgi:hypothetical protein